MQACRGIKGQNTESKSTRPLTCALPKSPFALPLSSLSPSLSVSSMRIRRRPQQPSLHQAASSDPATSACSPSQTPWNRGCLEGDDGEGRPDLGGQKSGVARRLALPQDNAADSGVGAGAGAGRGAGDVVVHVRCQSTVENGHHSWDQRDSGVTTCKKAEDHASNGGGVLRPMVPSPPAVAVMQDEAKVVSNGNSGASKKRRGPAVLLEGSRCSRVNGRGWRCSQPTLVGYSLCEHHLGKGRARSSAGAGGGPGQLGRTEHRSRVLPASSTATAGAVTLAAPNAEA